MLRHTMWNLQCVILFPLMLSCAQCASILFYSGPTTYSHRIALMPFAERLAADGHDVTYLSGSLPKKPNVNVTEFSPKALQDFTEARFGTRTDLVQMRMDGVHIDVWYHLEDIGTGMCEILMQDEEYLNLVKNKKFDLVVLDMFNNECAYGLIHYQKAKFVIYNPTHPMQWHYDLFGIPAETSWISDLAYGYEYPMSFTQRFMNTLRHVRWYYTRVYNMYPKLEAMINKGLGLEGDNAVSIQDVQHNVSVVFTCTHYSVDYSRSLPPLFVNVPGLHVENTKGELPKDMKKFADESGSDGFIYISFGSAAQISKAKPEFQRTFLNALRKSKTRFILKWESDRIPNEMPTNVYTAKWMPQKDILAHPKIKAFMTHGGYLGTQEAVYHGVPLIVFPIFAEQDYNAERIHRVGNGIRLEVTTLTEKDLTDAISAILTNPSYKEKMQEVSNFFNDRQIGSMETAVWWIEFVLRNKQNPFILPLGAHQSWYVRRSLDVWGSIIGSVFFVTGLLFGCGLRRGHTVDKLKTN